MSVRELFLDSFVDFLRLKTLRRLEREDFLSFFLTPRAAPAASKLRSRLMVCGFSKLSLLFAGFVVLKLLLRLLRLEAAAAGSLLSVKLLLLFFKLPVRSKLSFERSKLRSKLLLLFSKELLRS